MDHPTLRRILTEPRNALLKQYTKLFSLEGIKLNFTHEAIDYIAGKAVEFKLGARGLRSICEAVMNDAMFDLPSDKQIKEFTITADYALERLERTHMKKMLKAA